METLLLQTKLHIPPPRSGLVSRPRLIKRLNEGLRHKLTLISAPAGFGKTTLVSDWLGQIDLPAAWLSLDESDNDLARFLTYFIAALQQTNPETGQTAQGLLQTPRLPRLETLLTLLINDIAACLDEFILVLDDYHAINNQTIHEAMDFLIGRMPAQLHLVIASRSQPSLTLSRLRGQAQLLELNSADLRFTAVEVEKFLKDTMQLNLSPPNQIALEMRTEGWIAGLQLAALALQGQLSQPARQNISAFITSFAGTDRYIGDYLFEEVLRRQPDEVRHFLLFTSVADSLCGSLCDAILAESGNQAMLERLDGLQLFIVPLDNQRRWYRYHHLFVELLRHHLRQTYPEQIPLLHQRASVWFERHDHLENAIRHSLMAQDFERAAGLLETIFRQRGWVRRDMHRLLEWFEALPAAVTQTRPKLELGVAWLLLEIFSDRWEQIEAQLRRVETMLTAPDASASRSTSEQETQQLLAEVDLLRANHARQSGQPARVIALCQQALDRLPDNDTYLRSGIIAHFASAYESLGQMEQAGQLYHESIRLCRTAANVDGLLFAAARLIEVLTVNGQLRQAEMVFGQLGEYAAKRTGPDMGLVFINIGEVYREQNQLEQAKTYLEQGLELCRPFEAWRAGLVAGGISLAQVLAAEGRHAEAMKVLLEIEKHPGPSTPLASARLESIRARLLLVQDNFNAAARWARRRGLSVKDEIDYEREPLYLTLARVLLAQAALQARGFHPLSIAANPLKAADSLLERLHRVTLAGGRMGRVIEIRLLQALLHGLRQETAAALHRLEEALSLAEAEGYARLFVDEGRPLYQLLRLLSGKPTLSISPDYVRSILAAFPQARPVQPDILPGNTLTDRELKTLQLLATELSIEDIAARMTVSVSTVRTYTKRIYSKLDVHSRAEAIYRAKELKLL